MQSNEFADEAWRPRLESQGLEVGRSVNAGIHIETPAETVWHAIAKPGNLLDIHPFCAQTKVECWPGPGSRDSITYYSGIRYQRRFVSWYEGVGYDIELGDPPSQTARVRWRIQPRSPNACRLSIEVLPLLRADLSPEKKHRYQNRLFGAVLQHYLDCVVKGVHHFATTGTRVGKDQFGKNELYSD